MKQKPTQALCQITHRKYSMRDLIPLVSLRPAILELIKKDHPKINLQGYISATKMNRYRSLYVKSLMESETGVLSNLDKEVLASLIDDDVLSKNIQKEISDKSTFGQHLADQVATFGGSWGFVICFFLFILVWIVINMFWLANRSFDPFPFILLNLCLSCLAAIQAPIIMMSQNRQEFKDRQRSLNDYKVNLKSEIEIRQLHEKIDHLLQLQGQHLMEIQEIQVDLMEQILANEQEQTKKILKKRTSSKK